MVLLTALRSTHEYDTSERRAVESYLDEPKKARSRYALKDLIVEENTEYDLLLHNINSYLELDITNMESLFIWHDMVYCKSRSQCTRKL